MAVQFDESNDHYSIAGGGSLTLPNSDWCVATWTNVADNSGGDFQYLISTNNFATPNSFNLYITETDRVNDPDAWKIVFNESTPVLTSSSTPGGDGVDRLIVIQRSSGTLQMYFCVPGGSASLEDSASIAAGSNGSTWNIGRRFDGDATRYYGGIAGELFKGNFALTSEEITALGNGMPPYRLGHVLDMYQPMHTAEPTLKDLVGVNDMTRVDTPTTVEHFPVGIAEVISINYDIGAVGVTIPVLQQNMRGGFNQMRGGFTNG